MVWVQAWLQPPSKLLFSFTPPHLPSPHFDRPSESVYVSMSVFRRFWSSWILLSQSLVKRELLFDGKQQSAPAEPNAGVKNVSRHALSANAHADERLRVRAYACVHARVKRSAPACHPDSLTPSGLQLSHPWIFFFFLSIMIRGRSCCYPLPSGLSVQRPSDGETDVQRSKWSSQRQYSHLNTMHKVLQRQLRVGACHFIYRQGSHASEV